MEATLAPPKPVMTVAPSTPSTPSAGHDTPTLFRRVLQDRRALLSEIVDGERVPLSKVLGASLLLTSLGGLALGAALGSSVATTPASASARADEAGAAVLA